MDSWTTYCSMSFLLTKANSKQKYEYVNTCYDAIPYRNITFLLHETRFVYFQKVKWFTAQILTGKLNLALIFTYRVEIYLLHGMVTVKVLTNLSHLDRNLEKILLSSQCGLRSLGSSFPQKHKLLTDLLFCHHCIEWVQLCCKVRLWITAKRLHSCSCA